MLRVAKWVLLVLLILAVGWAFLNSPTLANAIMVLRNSKGSAYALGSCDSTMFR